MYRKEIVYDRETRDYAMYLDGELVGFARTYHEAEVTLDQLVFELLSGEAFREAPPVETHARLAEAPTFTYADLDNQPASDAFPDEPIGDCALDGKPAWRLDETLTAPLCPDHKAQERTWIANRDGETPDPNDIPPPDGPGAPPNIPSDGRSDGAAQSWPMSDAAREQRRAEILHLSRAELRRRYIARTGDTHPSPILTRSDLIEMEALAAWNEASAIEVLALTGAPVAPVDSSTPVASTLPSASQDGAAAGVASPPAPAPQMCHWCMMPYERMVGGVPCCHWCATRVRSVAPDLDPRATLIALLKASLEEWQALGIPTDYDVALAQLARLMTPPKGHFLTCGVCGGPHRGWQCPKVAAEKRRQIEQAKWGETICYLLRHHRDVLIGSMQTAPLVAERAEALSLYLTHATGTPIPIALVQRHLAQLAQQNAAPA